MNYWTTTSTTSTTMPWAYDYGTTAVSSEQVRKQNLDIVMEELSYKNHYLQSQIDELRAEIAWIREKSIFIND